MHRLLLILIFFVIAANVSSCGTGDGEISSYPLRCSDGQITNTKCSGSWLALNQTTYKVFVEQQQVIYWMPGFDSQLGRLSNCVVRDRENWKCKYSDGSAELIMVDGTFRETFQQKNIYSEILYVSWWHWWRVTIGQYI
jgi:hypothetical protein